MKLDLTAGERAFRGEVRAFIARTLTPEMKHGQRRCTSLYPEPGTSRPWQQALHERGWLVPLWPTEWGGTGWTPLQRFIFETECALAGAPLVHPMGVRLVGPVILRFGTETQKREHLPRILASTDYWCQGFSEPNAGSDLAALKLRAESDGSDYVLTGTKIWTTHAHHANRMFALVRTSHEGKRQQGISFLLIDMHSPGITVRPIATIGGDHDVNEVHFDAVRVPKTNRVGEENAGWECAKYLLEFERGAGVFSPRLRAQLGKVAEAVAGAAAVGYAMEELQRRFGELAADLDTFEWLELRSLAEVTPGASPGPVASILKLRGSRLKQAIAELGVDALGLASLRWRDGTSQRAQSTPELRDLLLPEYCNSRANTIFGGAAEVQLGLIARTVVGV